MLEQSALAVVTIHTADGRELTGEVDSETDCQLLWIRQQRERIQLTSSVAWSNIIAASQDGNALPIEQLQQELMQQASSEPVGFLVQKIADERHADYSGSHPTIQVQNRTSSRANPKVRSLEVGALLANLDRDVETDGIELTIAALDVHGVPVSVKGSLYVRLWGERIHPHGSLVQYEILEEWNQPVMPVDFVNGLATYALPFRTVHPEFDLGLHAEGLVNVELGVFGQGNFAASAPVALREFHPFRDRLQQTHGGRFLPDELTQRTRHALPMRTHTRALDFN